MRYLAVEARVWGSLARWARTPHPDGVNRFGYGGQLRVLLYAVLALAVVEGVVIDFLLGLLTDSIVWPILAAGLHVYALCWILGILASFRTLPHEIRGGQLVLHNSVFSGVAVPIARIDSVRLSRTARTGSSGLKVDPEMRSAVLGHGDTTVRIHLSAFDIRDVPVDIIDVTVDDPRAFVAAFVGR